MSLCIFMHHARSPPEANTFLGLCNCINVTSQEKTVSSGSHSPLVGLCLVMLAQVIQAAQCVCEERLLKVHDIPGTLVVAYEGVWGTLIMVVFVFPVLYFLPGNDVGGRQENTLDTVTMIENSSALQIMLCIYLLSCCTYNVARMLITSSLSAVHFTMIDASRTCIIWTLDLGLRYWSSDPAIQKFGEEWTPFSPLQAIGFLILILGQMVYGGLVQLPFQSLYPPPDIFNSMVQSFVGRG